MFVWLIFVLLFWNNVFARVYPVCSGFYVNIKHYRTGFQDADLVYTYSFDINMNLNKNFVDKNEIIISNYTYWSYNEAVFYRGNSSYICSRYSPNCYEWIPSGLSFSQELPFVESYMYNYVQIDSSLRTDSFMFWFDKNLMVYAYYDYSKWYFELANNVLLPL